MGLLDTKRKSKLAVWAERSGKEYSAKLWGYIMSLTFLNKVPYTNRQGVWGLILRIFLIIVILMVIMRMALRGVRATELVLIAFMIRAIIPRGKKGKLTHYDEVMTRIDFAPDQMRIVYHNIDRHDRQGDRTEEYTIAHSGIQKMDYRAESNALTIWSKPLVQISNNTGGRQVKDYRDSADVCELVLYPTDDVKAPLLSQIEEIGRWSSGLEKI